MKLAEPTELKRFEEEGRRLEALVPIHWQKRAFDVALSLVLILLLSPLLVLIAAAIVVEGLVDREARGPVFLTEPRGSEGRIFDLPKFRIVKMEVFYRVRATQKYQHIKPMESEPENLTRVGALLKTFYLDELPQLFSILKGDMSFVGPRPWPLEIYYEELDSGILRKKLIRPGLTGLVQANKGTEGGPTEWELDYAYIGFMHATESGWTALATDLGILRRSLRTVSEGKGL